MRQQKTERTANRFIDTLLVLTLFLWLAPHPVKAEKFVFTTAWTAQAQFAGYYIAKEKPFTDSTDQCHHDVDDVGH